MTGVRNPPPPSNASFMREIEPKLNQRRYAFRTTVGAGSVGGRLDVPLAAVATVARPIDADRG
jgi:hypothetical protein